MPISENIVPPVDSVSAQLAEKLCHVRFSDFPAPTVHKAKLHILDTLGAALAGSTSAETQSAWHALGLQMDKGQSAAWGMPFDLNPRSASFINGVSAHALELDDSGGCDHSGAVVVPAAFAILPQLKNPISGHQLLTAILMGYEVGRRVLEAVGGYEVHNNLGWHSTGTCGVFGAAAATGLLLGLDAPRLEQALGIACSFSGGTWGFIHDGSQTKKLHPGRAAEGGLTAALLAESGFTGPAKVFDPNAWGSFFKTFSPKQSDPTRLIEGFGESWRLDRCSIKPYATCRGTHSAVDAIRQLRSAHQIRPEQIIAIDVQMSRFQFDMCGGKTISSRAQAQMSLPYAIAAELQFGKVGVSEIEPAAWTSPRIAEWLSRVSVHIDNHMADADEPVITIATSGDHRHTATVPFPYGSPKNPLPDDQLIAKFHDLSGGILLSQRRNEIVETVLRLEVVSDARTLPTLLKTRA
ncbi:MAG: MmgE/PrpD family protein [Rhizomicrobium sp.]